MYSVLAIYNGMTGCIAESQSMDSVPMTSPQSSTYLQGHVPFDLLSERFAPIQSRGHDTIEKCFLWSCLVSSALQPQIQTPIKCLDSYWHFQLVERILRNKVRITLIHPFHQRVYIWRQWIREE